WKGRWFPPATRRGVVRAWQRPWSLWSKARSSGFTLQHRGHRVMIGKRQHPVADNLAGFVAFAGDQQHVTALERRDAGADRLGTVGYLGSAGRNGKNGGADRGRIFAARIVVGDDDAVGILGGDAAHDRTLAGVAVAAGAEYDDELSAGVGTQGLQRLRHRVRLVRVIDEDRRAIDAADEFKAALGAGELFQRRERPRRIAAGCNHEPGSDRRVLHLKRANQRKFDRIGSAAVGDVYFLREAIDGAAHEPDIVAALADRHDPETTLFRGCNHLR